MANEKPAPDESREAFLYIVRYAKELMAEHMAMDRVLRDLTHTVNWKRDYRSYLEMAAESSAAAFAELEQAASEGKDIRLAIERFAGKYPLARK